MKKSERNAASRLPVREAVSIEPAWAAFTVKGKAIGYYTQGKSPNWDRFNAYRNYMQHVQWAAKANGIKLPLKATEAQPVIVTTRLYCKTRVHHEPENVHKGAVDSLFYQPRGQRGGTQDKHVGGRFDPARYGDGERLEIEIAWPNGRAA